MFDSKESLYFSNTFVQKKDNLNQPWDNMITTENTEP